MTIVLFVEGDTERALKVKLKEFLDARAEVQNKPKIRLDTRKVIRLNRDDLRKRVRQELADDKVTAVVGLIDVYPNFSNAIEAKRFLREAVGSEPRFHPHAAQFDIEAWLLPYWDDICKRIGVRQAPPGAHPEEVNQSNPPSKRLKELFLRAKPRAIKYEKPLHMAAILRDRDLTVAAAQCPELKAFLNTLLTLSDLSLLK